MKNEIPIMDGIAKIKRCKSSNIWQFSMWIKKEKKYYRATTGTRNKEQAIEFAACFNVLPITQKYLQILATCISKRKTYMLQFYLCQLLNK